MPEQPGPGLLPWALAREAVEEIRPTTGALAAALITLNQWHGDQADFSTVLTEEAPYNLASTLPGIMSTECGDGDSFDEITKVNQVHQQSYIDAMLAGNWDAAGPWSCYLKLGTLNQTQIERRAGVLRGLGRR